LIARALIGGLGTGIGRYRAMLTLQRKMTMNKPETTSEATASEKLDWALHPRRSELDYGVAVKDPFVQGDRPGLGIKPDRKDR
jgi:hypothetical protein